MTYRAFKPLLLDFLRQAQINQNAFFQQLPPAELEIVGTPEMWSAKDHVAHMTFWRQHLVSRLQAIIREEAQPEKENFEELNPLIFEEHRYRPWSILLSESDQVYAELIELASQLTENDLTDSHRFDWINDGMPLYTTFMGNCYEHTQVHLAQYLLDHRDLKHALEIYEGWVNRVIELDVPETLKGYILYNLACFYATHSQLEQARTTLQQAFALYPATREFALTDPDLVALRPHFSD
ncbi:MAG TPA: DinB family protein [Ktedonobacteraceae bacterium]|jgi:tetratricopeptide (TPR) repeat protein